jgi:hypothetical protein
MGTPANSEMHSQMDLGKAIHFLTDFLTGKRTEKSIWIRTLTEILIDFHLDFQEIAVQYLRHIVQVARTAMPKKIR